VLQPLLLKRKRISEETFLLRIFTLTPANCFYCEQPGYLRSSFPRLEMLLGVSGMILGCDRT
jgi:hypothetical protein